MRPLVPAARQRRRMPGAQGQKEIQAGDRELHALDGREKGRVMGKSLTGKKDISKYAKRSWQTILLWIKHERFPACKIYGIWESDTDLIDAWKKSKILGEEK